jgi:hypothetical protein
VPSGERSRQLAQAAKLPRLDLHEVVIAAGAAEVYAALLASVARAFESAISRAAARAVGCEERAPGGPRPLEVGSRIAGFRVSAAVAGRELALTGRHRFSEYTLVFEIEAVDEDRVRLSAETRAAFPGLAARLYRAALIASRVHAVSVRALLAAVRRRAERGSG